MTVHSKIPVMINNIRDSILEITRLSQSLPASSSAVGDVVQQLARLLSSHDPALLAHGKQTALCAFSLATTLDVGSEDLDHLYRAALLHDIGILTLPSHMTHKTGPLAADEYAAIQSHPREGAELLALIPALQPAAVIVAHHHERWDGCGYPYGLRGEYIPLGSRILAVADTFDALTSENEYQAAQDPAAVLRLLERLAGSHLDPDLVAGFVRLAREINVFERAMPAWSTP